MRFKNTDAAIITTGKVLKSYKNIDCYLYARIEEATSKEDRGNMKKRYQVRTDKVTYKEYDSPVLNEDLEQIFDENNKPVTETKERLVFVEQLQDWSTQILTFEQYNQYFSYLDSEMPKDLSATDQEELKLRIMFLTLRKGDSPWGVDGNQWSLIKPSDLDRVK